MSHPASVCEMERSPVQFIALLCLVFSGQKRISGAELEMRIRPGDNVTLYCDCVWKPNYNPAWFRNCSHEHQPPFILVGADFTTEDYPRYSAVFNFTSNTYDLEIRNVTGADLGVYYCAMHEKTYSGHLVSVDFYHYGSRSTRLYLLEEAHQCSSVAPPYVPGWHVDWEVLVSVGTLCVLLPSLSSVCVYYFCRCTTEESERKAFLLAENGLQLGHTDVHQCKQTRNGKLFYHTEVYYTALNP